MIVFEWFDCFDKKVINLVLGIKIDWWGDFCCRGCFVWCFDWLVYVILDVGCFLCGWDVGLGGVDRWVFIDGVFCDWLGCGVGGVCLFRWLGCCWDVERCIIECWNVCGVVWFD